MFYDVGKYVRNRFIVNFVWLWVNVGLKIFKYLNKFGPDFHKGMLCVTNAPDWKLENNGLTFQYILIHIGNKDDESCRISKYLIDNRHQCNYSVFLSTHSQRTTRLFHNKWETLLFFLIHPRCYMQNPRWKINRNVYLMPYREAVGGFLNGQYCGEEEA